MASWTDQSGRADARPGMQPFQEQQGGVCPYESPQSKIHNARHGNRRPTPDKALPKKSRPVIRQP